MAEPPHKRRRISSAQDLKNVHLPLDPFASVDAQMRQDERGISEDLERELFGDEEPSPNEAVEFREDLASLTQEQEDELTMAATSMLQDSLALALQQSSYPEMLQPDEDDLAQAAAGMLNDSLALALEGWSDEQIQREEVTDNLPITPQSQQQPAAVNVAPISKFKSPEPPLQRSQTFQLHLPPHPSQQKSHSPQPSSASFQLHLPSQPSHQKPHSSTAVNPTQSNLPNQGKSRTDSSDPMDILNSAIQNAKKQWEESHSPTADDILNSSLEAAIHAQQEASGSPSPEDILNASIKAGVAALDPGSQMNFISDFPKNMTPENVQDDRSALEILSAAIASGLRNQEGLADAEMSLEDELQQMLADTANAASGSNIKYAAGPAIPEELALDVNKMLNEAVTTAASQEFEFIGALKRGRPKGSTKKEPTIYKCQFPGCGKEFPKQYSLKSHQSAHQTAKGFACRFCDAKFNRAHDQKRHERLHEATKVFVCQGCNKDFTRLDALKRHKANLRVLPACKDTPIIKQDRTGPVPVEIPLNPPRKSAASNSQANQPQMHSFSNGHSRQPQPPQGSSFRVPQRQLPIPNQPPGSGRLPQSSQPSLLEEEFEADHTTNADYLEINGEDIPVSIIDETNRDDNVTVQEWNEDESISCAT